MTLTKLDRWRASALHLGLSAAIGAGVVTLMLALWYPQPYFAAMGGDTLMLLLIGVDVVIGPLITLIVFNPKKKSLRFDLVVIALLQLAALGYGCQVMFQARPVYTVFVVDRFEAVSANAVDEDSLTRAGSTGFRSLPLGGPKIVAARPPTDTKRQTDVLMSAIGGGPDLANMADLYVPYAQASEDAARVAKPLADLAKRQPQEAATIRAFVDTSGRSQNTLGYVPLKARSRDMAVVVDTKTGDVVGIIPVYPW